MNRIPTNDMTIAAAFSLRMSHVAMVTQLAERLGVNRSAVIQQAIEMLYYHEIPPTPQAQP